MDCSHQCYTIGGPWIAEDPDCPVHGASAVREREHQEDRERSMVERIETLEAMVEAQAEQITCLYSMVSLTGKE